MRAVVFAGAILLAGLGATFLGLTIGRTAAEALVGHPTAPTLPGRVWVRSIAAPEEAPVSRVGAGAPLMHAASAADTEAAPAACPAVFCGIGSAPISLIFHDGGVSHPDAEVEVAFRPWEWGPWTPGGRKRLSECPGDGWRVLDGPTMAGGVWQIMARFVIGDSLGPWGPPVTLRSIVL